MYSTETTIHVVCIFSQDGSKNGASLFDQKTHVLAVKLLQVIGLQLKFILIVVLSFSE